ncbi:MAG: hypothetical protein GY930_06520 [bacterium]|nr:hypothetical protein [bacterium]
MTPSTTKRNLIIEDVINALYADGIEGGPQGNLRNQVKRLHVELGRRKASTFTKKLLNSLTESPDELVQLEALIMLGFAHPDVARKHHIALGPEGRRLGVLLEKAGRPDRAKEVLELLCEYAPEDRTMEIELAGIMRRAGNTEELIERYLERAQKYMGKGESKLALPWLQEAYALDRSRTDVSALILDARYHQHHRLVSSRSNRRFASASLLILIVAVGLGYRESKLHNRYISIPSADETNAVSMAARLGSLRLFQDENPYWLGTSRVELEIGTLVAIEQEILADKVEAKKAEAQQVVDKAGEANHFRQIGLQCSDRGEFGKALLQFEKALEVAPENWEHAGSTGRDVAAIRKLESSQ